MPVQKERQSKVLCPLCEQSWDSRVMQGMEDHHGRGYSRRRLCACCRQTYYTIEIVDERKLHPKRRGPKPQE